MTEPLVHEVKGVIPHARVGCAHGSQKPSDLASVVSAFVDGDLDILVCTPIIESGLHIPNANTIVVHRPDLFGLAQLHQLRGRVGRSSVQAYSYLLTDPTKLGHEKSGRSLMVSPIDRLRFMFYYFRLSCIVRTTDAQSNDKTWGWVSTG